MPAITIGGLIPSPAERRGTRRVAVAELTFIVALGTRRVAIAAEQILVRT